MNSINSPQPPKGDHHDRPLHIPNRTTATPPPDRAALADRNLAAHSKPIDLLDKLTERLAAAEAQLALLPDEMRTVTAAIIELTLPEAWTASLGWRDWSVSGREYVIHLRHNSLEWNVDSPVTYEAADGTWGVYHVGEFDAAQAAVDANIARYEALWAERTSETP